MQAEPLPASRAFAWWNRHHPTVGLLALAALAVAIATGVVLAVGYDVRAPADSVALLALTTPAGRLVRAAHAWSSHLLVALALLHVVEHLLSGGDGRVSGWSWLRLVLLVPAILGVALTGFMLKADAEGELAREVVRGLVSRLPLAGDAIATALVGAAGDLQIPYVHHVATLTIAVAVLALEHARRSWPPPRGVLAVALAAVVLGVLLPPRLHDPVDAVVKGPWYFVGVQEVLHHLAHPAWIWVLVLGPLVALLVARVLPPAGRRAVLASLAALLAGYALVGALAQVFRGPGWELRSPLGSELPSSRAPVAVLGPLSTASLPEARLPVVLGRREGCVGCHREVSGLGASHDPRALGCAACHLGDVTAPDAAGAHRGMVRVPGNLDTVPLTCGRAGCHDDVAARVRQSLMGTARGMVAVDRWALGEQPTPDGTCTAAQLGRSPADTHLRQLCVVCHLGTVKAELGPVSETTRGGGCAACHSTYPAVRDYRPERAERFTHPAVGLEVRDESCFGCHSRSGRISLAYAGWWEAGLDDESAAKLPPGATRRLADGRILARGEEDVHHARGMSCADCHTARELMGDGRAHLHEDEATRVRCETCHRVSPARSVSLEALPPEAKIVVRARYGDAAPARFLLEDRGGEPLTNAWPLADGTVELRTKLGGKRLVGRPPAPACSAVEGHERLSCRSCHETWVTQCGVCHTQWDPGLEARDGPTGRSATGGWVEYDGPPNREPPVLGVRERDGRALVEPFAPGMIMTLNGPALSAPSPLPGDATALIGRASRFLRAFAPVVPHTTQKVGLSCATCHREPRAVGYGQGELRLVPAGGRLEWRFEPARGPWPFDGLPADAWTSPDGRSGVATRGGARPLDAAERERTLAVGACLECHDPARTAGARIYAHYRDSLSRLGPSCRVPTSVRERAATAALTPARGDPARPLSGPTRAVEARAPARPPSAP